MALPSAESAPCLPRRASSVQTGRRSPRPQAEKGLLRPLEPFGWRCRQGLNWGGGLLHAKQGLPLPLSHHGPFLPQGPRAAGTGVGRKRAGRRSHGTAGEGGQQDPAPRSEGGLLVRGWLAPQCPSPGESKAGPDSGPAGQGVVSGSAGQVSDRPNSALRLPLALVATWPAPGVPYAGMAPSPCLAWGVGWGLVFGLRGSCWWGLLLWKVLLLLLGRSRQLLGRLSC